MLDNRAIFRQKLMLLALLKPEKIRGFPGNNKQKKRGLELDISNLRKDARR